MRLCYLTILVFVMAASISAIGQERVQEPNKTAHESVIDGRWELKSPTEKADAMTFEFKNDNGVLTGVVIENKKSTDIKSGTLDGSTIKFETTQTPAGATQTETMIWRGVVSNDGTAIMLSCAPQGRQVDERSRSQMELRRVK